MGVINFDAFTKMCFESLFINKEMIFRSFDNLFCNSILSAYLCTSFQGTILIKPNIVKHNHALLKLIAIVHLAGE